MTCNPAATLPTAGATQGSSQIVHVLTRYALAAMFALATTLCHATLGQPGTLDPFWATASSLGPGKVITTVGANNDSATAIALQPDGKLVLAGFCYVGANRSFCALRYDSFGVLDPTFNGTGKIITPVGTASSGATSIALQPDGKLVLAGFCYDGANTAFCALRYDNLGVLDPTFNSTGIAITQLGTGNSGATSIAMQPDGKLVLAGNCYNGANLNFCALRYDRFGVLDNTFNRTGIVITPIGTYANATAIALQPDGNLVVAGMCQVAGASVFCALRYDSFGVLDQSFNRVGIVFTQMGSVAAHANALALQPDGKLIVAGSCDIATGNFNITNSNFCAARYGADGAFDTTFNGTGKVITPFGINDTATAIALQPDGKLILAGSCRLDITAQYKFCAFRYNATGELDNTFNGNGNVATPVGTMLDTATAIALQPDGKLVLAGHCATTLGEDFCAIRYDGGPFAYNQCSLDLDGDNAILPTTDALIHLRIALGFTGNAVVSGITFPPTATRTTWPAIRTFLVAQCGLSLSQ